LLVKNNLPRNHCRIPPARAEEDERNNGDNSAINHCVPILPQLFICVNGWGRSRLCAIEICQDALGENVMGRQRPITEDVCLVPERCK
jgi:hypothetical protein